MLQKVPAICDRRAAQFSRSSAIAVIGRPLRSLNFSIVFRQTWALPSSFSSLRSSNFAFLSFWHRFQLSLILGWALESASRLMYKVPGSSMGFWIEPFVYIEFNCGLSIWKWWYFACNVVAEMAFAWFIPVFLPSFGALAFEPMLKLATF